MTGCGGRARPVRAGQIRGSRGDLRGGRGDLRSNLRGTGRGKVI